MIVFQFHSSVARPLTELLAGLLPRGDEPWPRDLAEHRIEHFDFSGAQDDEEWLADLSADCVVVACLGKAHRAVQVFKGTHVRFVNMAESFARMNRFEQAHFLTGAWTAIVARTHRAKPGTGVAPNGRKVEEL